MPRRTRISQMPVWGLTPLRAFSLPLNIAVMGVLLGTLILLG
jgi:hypothetical protein